MGIFITQGNYTEQAMKGMIDKPEDRASAVATFFFLESVGAKLLQLYVTTGEYDFLLISECDNLTDLVAGVMIGEIDVEEPETDERLLAVRSRPIAAIVRRAAVDEPEGLGAR